MSDHDSTEGMDPLAAAGSGAFKLLQTIASGRGGLTAVLFSKQLVAHDQRRLKMIGELARTDPGLRELLGLNNQLQLPEADPSAFEGDGAQPSVPQIVAAQEAGILPSEAGSRHPLWLRFYREEQQKQESTGRVLDAAKRELDRREEAGQQPAEEPVDATWASRFFEQAKLIQDAEMQEAWGRLLAEEVISRAASHREACRFSKGWIVGLQASGTRWSPYRCGHRTHPRDQEGSILDSRRSSGSASLRRCVSTI